ncbi:MAG: hypothetical protein OHK0040_01260 [bacterium]
MKKTVYFLIFSICFSLFTSCYGKFQLTRKVYEINSQVKDKFLRSATTWAFIIIPVYGVAALLDFVLFNTVEFWTGKNPIAKGEKEFFYAKGDDLFYIKAKKAGTDVTYNIRHYKGSVFIDKLEIKWDLRTGNSIGQHEKNGVTERYAAFIQNGDIRVTKDGNQLAFNSTF